MWLFQTQLNSEAYDIHVLFFNIISILYDVGKKIKFFNSISYT